MQTQNIIKVMTFNLRRDSRHDNQNRWPVSYTHLVKSKAHAALFALVSER